MKDELTTAMHAELTISKETEMKHRVFTAIESIDDGTFTREEAMDAYNITLDQLRKWEPVYRKLMSG